MIVDAHYLPISFFQKLMIAAAADPETQACYHQHFTIRWGFRITPGLSERTLRRAFDKLVARHDSLRLRFVDTGGDWCAEILANHPTGLSVEDLSDLSPERQSAEIETRANACMTAFSEPMFEMLLFKCGRGGDVIVIRAHHAIMDGYSIVVLMEELLKLALNMPLPGAAGSHAEFIRHRERVGQSDMQTNERFWEQALLPAPEPLRIGRVAHNLPPISRRSAGDSQVLENVLTKAQSHRLETFAKRAGVTVFAAVHAAFCEAVYDMTGQDEVIVCSWLGRQDARLRNFIGADMQPLIRKFRRGDTDLADRARNVVKGNQDAARFLPCDLLLPDSALAAELAAKGVTLWRFAVHNSFPSGRMSNSPFRKLFWAGLQNKVSFGALSIERLSFSGPRDTMFELIVKVNSLPEGPNITVAADAEAYTRDDLEHLMARMMAGLEAQDDCVRT